MSVIEQIRAYEGEDIADGDVLAVPAGVYHMKVGAAGTSTGTSKITSSMPEGRSLLIECGANAIKINTTAVGSEVQDCVQLVSSRTMAPTDELELRRVRGVDSTGAVSSWWKEVRFTVYST